MVRIPIVVPQLGESLAEATIVRLNVSIGDPVQPDQEIIDVETSKATMGITAPCAGRVVAISAQPNESHPVGAVIGILEVDPVDAERLGLLPMHPQDDGDPPSDSPKGALQNSATSRSQNPDVPPDQPELAGPPRPPALVEPTVRGLPVPVNTSGATYLSPRMRARMHDLGLNGSDLAGLAGSGAGGRVTVDDFEKFIADIDQKRTSPASSMRVAVADAMRRSWSRPLATVGRSVCLDPLMAHRKQESRKTGPALYALRALAVALGENSAPAGRLIGGRIVHPGAIDVGFAVEAEDGVLVPVLRNADRVCLTDLVERYNHLVELARQRKLPPDATGGSVATVTNFGTFGIVWATPIPLPEQTLVLGLGAGTTRPKWDSKSGQFLPALEAEMTLSFDHRVLDGGGAGRLLTRIAELLQDPAKL